MRILLLLGLVAVAYAAPATNELLKELKELLEAENKAHDVKYIYEPSLGKTAHSIYGSLQRSISWDEQGKWKIGIFYNTAANYEKFKNGTQWQDYKSYNDWTCDNAASAPCFKISGEKKDDNNLDTDKYFLKAGTEYKVYSQVKFDNGDILTGTAYSVTTLADKEADLKKALEDLLSNLLE